MKMTIEILNALMAEMRELPHCANRLIRRIEV